LNSAGNVKVSVERFGAERQQDAMFEGYDERCNLRVRSSFRLPPLFIGYAQDYNYATAVASYQIAEAQVFKPERDEFDETINVTIMRELAPEYVFRSKPMTVHNIDSQIKAIQMMQNFANKKELIDEVNELVGLHLKYEKPPESMGSEGKPMTGDSNPAEDPFGFVPPSEPVYKVEVEDGKIAKTSDSLLLDLAKDWAAYMSGDVVYSPASVVVMKKVIDTLNPKVRNLFNTYVAEKMLSKQAHDPEGTTSLMACATDVASAGN
jgi:hypothetical protein